ncbi:MAG: isocitrate lyase/PEP mutase family protein [Proteobacteria bacterium]|nr:isocitrate lyase/PEP mutase family protein [Pseudomonadota bacterium]MBI3496221.1 isocitrate lyase/PEP mutase family protein [Pseudomonadota bacterium]
MKKARTPSQRLRALLRRGGLTVPSCYDALGFRMIARAGFPAAFLSGFSVSAGRLGVPDAGLLSYGEMADQARNVTAAAAIPLIVDADTGFGNAQNVQRTVRGLAGAGAACLMLEDQESPKRDFGAPGAVVPRADAVRRVKAAVQAREAGADILIIGRTDARNAAGPASGLREALWRAAAFADLGADLVFVTGPAGAGELKRIRAAAALPQIVQVDEPGRAPRPPGEVHDLGFEVALYGVSLIFAAAAAFRDALAGMRRGLPLPSGRSVSPEVMADIVGVEDYLAVDRALAK